MKKQLIFLCALAAVATACNVEESGLNSDFSTITVTATLESLLDSKASYDDDGTSSWTENDVILVYTNAGRFYHMDIVSGAGQSTATFSGTISGETTGLGVYPYLGTVPTYVDDVLTVSLPDSYDWVEKVAYMPMVSFTGNANSFAFKSVGALFIVTLNNIPATATKVTFYTGKQITGSFKVDLDLADPVIYAGDDTNEGVGVTFNFDELQTSTNMVFYVPVPTGTYDYIAFDVQDAGNNSLWSFTGSSTQEMTRNKLAFMSTLTYSD